MARSAHAQAADVTAFVRRPGPRLADGLVTHIARSAIDLDRAIEQWTMYAQALADSGWSVVEVEPADDCPDAVFVEDAVVVFDDLAVVTRPGAESRRGETAGAAAAMTAAMLDVHHIVTPGTVDGGDVLKVGRTAFVGIGGRTNQAGVDQLEAVLGPRGWQVVAVPVSKVLHLKSAVTALPDGTVIGHPDLVHDTSAFDRFMAVPEPEGAHVVLLNDEHLLMSASAPRSAELFKSIGYQPVVVDISEFEKLEGCVTCLSVRLRRTPRSRRGRPDPMI
jgi:dimethylargininase